MIYFHLDQGRYGYEMSIRSDTDNYPFRLQPVTSSTNRIRIWTTNGGAHRFAKKNGWKYEDTEEYKKLYKAYKESLV